MTSGTFKISPELFCWMMGLPEGTDLRGAWWDWNNGAPCLKVLVTHPDLPECDVPLDLAPTWETVDNGEVKFVGWL